VIVGLKTKLLRGRIRVFQGTPKSPLVEPALFLAVRQSPDARDKRDTVASFWLVRPSDQSYVIKELITDMEIEPKAAVEKAVDIALRGEVCAIYLNADLDNLPLPVSQAG
jgi:hypothetical protein